MLVGSYELSSRKGQKLENTAKFEAVFNQATQSQSKFAVSASYSIEQSNPVVLTSGPTFKGGNIAVANDARWHIGSISKSFTATLIMRLVERGLLNLDQPVVTYLSDHSAEMHDDWKAATLRQLLSHTAGFLPNPPKLLKTKGMELTALESRLTVLSELWDQPKKLKVGAFKYSNTGYLLAGFVAETITGLSWEELITTEIAKPLGLNSLGFGAPQEPDAPMGHRGLPFFKRPVDPMDIESDLPKWIGPAGTLHLSMSDLAKWGQTHIRAGQGKMQDFLSKESCEIMQTPGAGNYGLGWVIQPSLNMGPVVWHNGSNTMWYALIHVVPERETVVAIATNVVSYFHINSLHKKLSLALMTD